MSGINWMNEAMKASQAVGHCRGYFLGMMLYDSSITPSRFEHIYEAFKRSHELMGDEIHEFDMSRIQKRADEIGATIK
jgi:hypothetical protein